MIEHKSQRKNRCVAFKGPKITTITKLIGLFLGISIAPSLATEWNLKIDEDSTGPRCLIFAESVENIEGMKSNNLRIAYFSAISFRPMQTEFVYKFSASTTPPLNPHVTIGKVKFKLIYKNQFAWLAKKSMEKPFLKAVQNAKKMTVQYQVNGRLIEDTYQLNGFLTSYSKLSSKCKMKM